MDVAEKKGIHIDIKKLGERLGIPVAGFVASETKRYRELKQQFADAIREAKIADSAQLMKFYEKNAGNSFKELAEKQKEERLFTKEAYKMVLLIILNHSYIHNDNNHSRLQ